jgi:hypothetical protein
MRDNVMAHPTAGNLFKRGKAEQTILFNENEKIDYEIKNVNHKDNVVSNANCFLVALGSRAK